MYIYILIYAHITYTHPADDDVYVRFLERSATGDNATAKAQLAAMQRVADLVQEISDAIEQLRICGLAKLHAMCEFVRARDSPVFTTQDRWTICSVSSCPTSQCALLGEHGEWAVDVSFLPFFRMLWIVYHLDHIEQSKFVNYIATRPPGEKIIDSLRELPLVSDYTPETQYEHYVMAFRYVRETLHDTIATYTTQFMHSAASAQRHA